MGYCSNFEVTLFEVSDPDLRDELNDSLEDLIGYKFGTTTDQMKWYDCVDDLTKLSAKFPEVKFFVEVMGEDQPDMWRAYFFNGEANRVWPAIVWPLEVVWPE